MKQSQDEYRNGFLYNGYDYTRQAWVSDGVYMRCGHLDSVNCQCYGKKHEGESSKEREVR